MPATRIDYILQKKKKDSLSPKTVEELVAEKYLRKPLWDNPLYLAKKFLRNLNKIQPPATTSMGVASSERLVQVEIPGHVSLIIGKNNNILVTGIRGSLVNTFGPELSFEKKDNVLFISSSNETTATAFSTQTGILYRMLVGVTRGYKESVRNI